MARYGQLYDGAVLRPFAEQLAAALDVQPGQTVCDLLSDEGELMRALAARVAPDGTVLTAGIDTVIRLGGVPLADGVCDAAGVLFTAGFAADLRSEARRVCRPRGRVLAAVWDPEHPPAHEQVLDAALQTAARHSSAYLRAVLAAPIATAGVSVSVHDVVRFDGFAHYWAAMVRQRLALMAELSAIPEPALREAQDVSRAALARYAVADGTLRIPVSARFVPL